MNATNSTRRVVASYAYPFRMSSFSFQYINISQTSINCVRDTLNPDRPLSGAAEFFMALTVFSFVYTIVMVPVYVFFYTPKVNYSKNAAILVSMSVPSLPPPVYIFGG